MSDINAHRGKSFKYKGRLLLDGVEYDYCKNDGYVVIHDKFHGENTGFKGNINNDFAECVDFDTDNNAWEGLEIPVFANMIARKQFNQWRKENKTFAEVEFIDDESGVRFKFYNAKVSKPNGSQITPNQADVVYLKGSNSDYI